MNEIDFLLQAMHRLADELKMAMHKGEVGNLLEKAEAVSSLGNRIEKLAYQQFGDV